MERIPFKRLCFMIDCSRNAVMNVDNLKSWIDILQNLGFNSLMLYTEDTYEVDGHPYFGYARGRYTKEELKTIDRYARSRGIEVIPYIQTLAHIEQLFRWRDYSDLCDCDDILICDEDKTYQLIEDMFSTLEECFSTRIVNVGMDEAKSIGRGKYYDIHGNCDKKEILLRHTKRVAKIAKDHGFDICMWSDMFIHFATGSDKYFCPDAEIDERVGSEIPENASLIYWDYYKRSKQDYTNMLKLHEKLKDGTWYAGGIWTWEGFATQNRYSIEALKNNLESCRECGVENLIITTWGDGGAECSVYEALPTLFFASEYIKGNFDMEEIKAHFEGNFGVSFDDFMLFDQVMREEKDVYYRSPSKYLLYNDPFIGLVDTAIPDRCNTDFEELAKLTEPLVRHERWGYLFRTNHKLCLAIAKKCDIGIRIRRAYKESDMIQLLKCADDLEQIKDLVYDFYLAFRERWMRENKSYGFEIQDIRLGGLMTRITHCREVLLEYINGRISKIEELECEPLDPHGTRFDMPFDNEYIRYNRWCEIVTAGKLFG